jgi:hypothetical protein
LSWNSSRKSLYRESDPTNSSRTSITDSRRISMA